MKSLTHSSAEHRGALVLMAVLILSLTLKLTVWAILLPTPDRFENLDSALYDSSARSLLHLGAFTPSPELPGIAETRRTPGYPLFLAGSYALFGEHYAPVLFVQILISVATIALVYWLARRLWDTRVAALAAVLLLLDIPSFTSSLKVMSDTLFVFLTTALLAAGAAVILRDRKTLPALAVGVLLTLATFIRPVTYYLVVPLALGVILMAATKRWRWRTSMVVLLVIVAPYVLGVGAWQVRNGRLTGSSEFCSLEGFSLLYYRGAPIVALRDGIRLSEARAKLGLERGHAEHYLETGWTPELDEAWKREARELIFGHPILFLRSQLPGAKGLMLAPGDGDLLRLLGMPVRDPSNAGRYLERFSTPGTAIFSGWAILYLVVVYSGVLCWVWARASDRTVTAVDLFFWVVLLYLAAVSAGQGDSRIRLPMMPLLVMYSALGLSHLWSRFQLRRGAPG